MDRIRCVILDDDVNSNLTLSEFYHKLSNSVRLSECDIYGSKRLGSLDTAMRVYPKVPANIGGTIDSTTVAYLENQKQYEITNHLGNVLVTVSDRKWWIDTASLGYA